jgi:hypothetical protein
VNKFYYNVLQDSKGRDYHRWVVYVEIFGHMIHVCISNHPRSSKKWYLNSSFLSDASMYGDEIYVEYESTTENAIPDGMKALQAEFMRYFNETQRLINSADWKEYHDED